MRLLIVEDEADFIAKVSAVVTTPGTGMELVSPTDVGLAAKFDEGVSYEEQLLARIRKMQQGTPVDLVLLDSDLSRMGNGISQSMCRQAFQEVGLPVCRYKKKHSTTQARDLQDLKRTAREGASAVWVPSDMVQVANLSSKLLPWLTAIGSGFAQLRQTLQDNPTLLQKYQGPAGILALALGRPAAKADFLGYTAQNFFFFGAPAGEDEDDPSAPLPVLTTQLGYWLINYILLFPGPILPYSAAAAFLNLQLASFDLPEVQALIESARYTGPFAEVDKYFWKDDLGDVLDGLAGDIATAPSLQGKELQRVDPAHPGESTYYCVLTKAPIAETEASSTLDWIPAGAQLARIQRDLYDKLGPMLVA